MSDTDATQARQDVVAEVDEIIEHVINANMLSMPYDVYSELFDAVDGLGVEIENLKAENAKLRELAQRMWRLERFGCYGCRRECDAESCYASDCKEAIEIEQEMRDLGMEVES